SGAALEHGPVHEHRPEKAERRTSENPDQSGGRDDRHPGGTDGGERVEPASSEPSARVPLEGREAGSADDESRERAEARVLFEEDGDACEAAGNGEAAAGTPFVGVERRPHEDGYDAVCRDLREVVVRELPRPTADPREGAGGDEEGVVP